jgi:hypothetical protein
MMHSARLTMVLAGLVLSPIAALAQESGLNGVYTVEGQNPGGKGSYRGELAIAPIGDAYRVVWRVGNQPYEGTGLLRDGKLAVVFRTGQQAGIAFYDVRENGTLTGTWTTLGGQVVGTETLTPKGRT